MVRPLLFALALVSTLALALLPVPAHAWGPLGHRLVALLAWDDLTPASRRQIEALLKDEQDPTLAGIASWADDLRESDPVLGRKTTRWHYVNTIASTRSSATVRAATAWWKRSGHRPRSWPTRSARAPNACRH
jgi:hypothetical protein